MAYHDPNPAYPMPVKMTGRFHPTSRTTPKQQTPEPRS